MTLPLALLTLLLALLPAGSLFCAACVEVPSSPSFYLLPGHEAPSLLPGAVAIFLGILWTLRGRHGGPRPLLPRRQPPDRKLGFIHRIRPRSRTRRRWRRPFHILELVAFWSLSSVCASEVLCPKFPNITCNWTASPRGHLRLPPRCRWSLYSELSYVAFSWPRRARGQRSPANKLHSGRPSTTFLLVALGHVWSSLSAAVCIFATMCLSLFLGLGHVWSSLSAAVRISATVCLSLLHNLRGLCSWPPPDPSAAPAAAAAAATPAAARTAAQRPTTSPTAAAAAAPVAAARSTRPPTAPSVPAPPTPSPTAVPALKPAARDYTARRPPPARGRAAHQRERARAARSRGLA